MANLFERMGLVRAEYDGPPIVPYSPDVFSSPDSGPSPEVPEIDASQVSCEDIIPSIYEQAEIGEDNSIFKIKAYLDVLPMEMTKAKKQATVAGILAVNGVNVDCLMEDGQRRIHILETAQDSIREESDELIADAENEIEHLKSLIEEAESRAEESKKKCAASTAAIQKEKEAVGQLLDFADGLADKEGV